MLPAIRTCQLDRNISFAYHRVRYKSTDRLGCDMGTNVRFCSCKSDVGKVTRGYQRTIWPLFLLWSVICAHALRSVHLNTLFSSFHRFITHQFREKFHVCVEKPLHSGRSSTWPLLFCPFCSAVDSVYECHSSCVVRNFTSPSLVNGALTRTGSPLFILLLVVSMLILS